MAQPLTVSLPPGLELWGGCAIRLTALDAATGNTVAGVSVSNATFEVAIVSAPQAARLNPVLLLRQP